MLEALLLAQSTDTPSPGIGAITALVLFIAASVWLVKAVRQREDGPN